jgi:hypothetical protein
MTAQEPAIRIEFIPDGSDDAPLILIWGYDIHATRDLFHSIRALRDGREQEIAIHKLPRFAGVGGVEVFAQMSATDAGVTKRREGTVFDWRLSDEEWQKVEDLLAPFCDRYAAPGPFQWLNDSGKISVVFSTGRGW